MNHESGRLHEEGGGRDLQDLDTVPSPKCLGSSGSMRSLLPPENLKSFEDPRGKLHAQCWTKILRIWMWRNPCKMVYTAPAPAPATCLHRVHSQLTAPAPAPGTQHQHRRQQPVSTTCTASSQHQRQHRRAAPATCLESARGQLIVI